MDKSSRSAPAAEIVAALRGAIAESAEGVYAAPRTRSSALLRESARRNRPVGLNYQTGDGLSGLHDQLREIVRKRELMHIRCSGTIAGDKAEATTGASGKIISTGHVR